MGALIPLAISIAPEIGRWLFGHGDTAADTVAAVARAVEAATGTKDESAQRSVIERSPEAAMKLRTDLAQIAAQAEVEARKQDLAALTARFADTAEARAQTVALAEAKSGIAWGAPVVSLVVLVTFAIVMALAFLKAVPAESEQVINLLLGALATMATSVVSYWVGSSAGSARKDQQIARLVQQP